MTPIFVKKKYISTYMDKNLMCIPSLDLYLAYKQYLNNIEWT